jgi:hypothetical protein
MCFSRTLLPEPLGPMSTKISPGSTVRLMSFRTISEPKFLETCSSVTPTAGLSASEKGFRVWWQVSMAVQSRDWVRK